tara:strand:- start:642 stop:1028 length:387 start_codon:yes stop_codon:yes gene_type:complete
MEKTKGTKGIFIDPWASIIKEVILPPNHKISDIHNIIEARHFDVLPLNKIGDGIYVDDEGLFRDFKCPWIANTDWGRSPLVNKGLILGCDEEGETISVMESFAKIKERIKFGMDAFKGYLREEKQNAH